MTATAHWDDAPSVRADVGPMGADWDFLGRAAGSDKVGVRRIRISPGRQSTPVHAHFGEEELFYVLGGSGWSWQEGGSYEIGEGDVFTNANTIILMGRTKLDGRMGRALYVPKHRGSYVGDEILPYRITDRGIVLESRTLEEGR